ncbi:MAG: hypothetical protein J6W89_02405 [Paludibacteraceae bacterium]|nr:hypothetical protein [Paludibacteraceae bacterium]
MHIAVWCMAMFSSCAKPSHDEVQVWYEQGKELRAQGEPQEAMALFLKAVHSSMTDETLLGRVYSNMANICRQANEHALAGYVYALSAEHFAASGDDLAYAYALNNMAWEQAAQAHKDSALLLVAEAVRIYPLSPLTDKVIETRAAACLFAQEYDSVLYYTLPPANDYLMMLRAQASSYMQMSDSATYYAQILLPRIDNPFYLDDIYYILTHDDLSADAETIRQLSSERADVQKTIEQRHGKLMLAVQLLAQNLYPARTDWRLITESTLIFLVCLSVLVFGIITIFERRKLYDERTEHDSTRRKEMNQSLHLLRESADLKQELAWSDYNAFRHQTDKLFHGLATTLEQQGLNEQDIRICVLVLIGLSHKQIAAILPCSQKSIGKLKDLTARKLGVSGGQLREKLNDL